MKRSNKNTDLSERGNDMQYKKGMDIPTGYELSYASKPSLRKTKIQNTCPDCGATFFTRGDKIYCDKCLYRKRMIRNGKNVRVNKIIKQNTI